MNSNSNYSELLYLVIDGEANADEKRTLFSALSQDENLQDEFYDALQMRSVAFNDAERMTPPAYIAQNILKGAGVATVAGTLASSSFLSNIPKMLPTVFGLVVGSLLTLGIIQWNNRNNTDIAAIPASIASESHAVPNTPQPSNVSLSEQQPPKQIVITKTVYVPVEQKRNTDAISQSTSTASIAKQVKNGLSNEEAPLKVTPSSKDVQSSVQAPAIPPNNGIESKLQDIQPELTVNEKKQQTLFVQLNGVRGLSIYSANIGTSQNRAFNNLSGSILYALSENASAGVVIGQEDLPLFVQRSSQDFVPYQSIFWAGAAFNYQFEPVVSFADIRPFVQPVLALTQVGPLVKTTAGLSWKPDSRVSLHAGAEALGLMFNNESNRYQVVSKFSISYGMSISF